MWLQDDPVLSRLRRLKRSEKSGGFIAGETIACEIAIFLNEHFSGEGERAILDLGAGTRPYAPLYERHFSNCVSTDVEFSPHDISGVDVIAPAEDLPFDDKSFDAVLCTEVLEHCREPWTALREIQRVLKPGGRALVTTPFMVPLHEMPHDYYRYTPSALEDLSSRAGLRVVSIRPRGDYLGLMVVRLGYPFWKTVQKLASVTGIRLGHPANPLVQLFLVLPQRLYLWFWRRARAGRPPFRAIHEKLNYYALGFTTSLQRPAL